MNALPRSFFDRDTVTVAKLLIGCTLSIRQEDTFLSGQINETEAYTQDDPASHSHRGRTPRNAVMFGPPGHLYVYFIYGMYWCANVVTEAEGIGAAVLLRGVTPLSGIDTMKRNRGVADMRKLCDGPGKLCQAFGIDKSFNGIDLCQDSGIISISEGSSLKSNATPRIGISKAKDRLWRFVGMTS